MGHQTRSPRKASKADEVHEVLRQHPNFSMPALDDPQSPRSVAKWVLAAVAAYVSPPKVEDEDDEIECLDLATAIRDHLGPEILERLDTARLDAASRR